MGKKTIKTTLDTKSINRAIREIQDYKKWLIAKTQELRRRVAEELAAESQSNFASAIVDDLLDGGGRAPDVSISVTHKGDISVVIASGEDAIWCEFGSGVYNNTPVGTSPHPKGAELGFTIGSYGKGKGARNVWGFYENGELKLTHGTRAQMPMYGAVQTVSRKMAQIGRGVFG